MANDYRLKGAIMLFGLVLCFFTILYFVRLYFIKEGFGASDVSTTTDTSVSSKPLVVAGTSFNIECPNSATPTITYGSAGSDDTSSLSGDTGSTPQTGIPPSTPAPTNSSTSSSNTGGTSGSSTNPYTSSLKPTIAQCQQYYTFDGSVN